MRASTKIGRTLAWRSIVLILLLSSLVLMTACVQTADSNETVSPTSTASSKFLSSSALAQKLALAIDGSPDIQTVYQEIPERQRSGVTADQFQRYIKLLRKGVSGQIASVVAMNDSQIASNRQQVTDRLPEQQDLLNRTDGYWLNIRDSGIIGDRIEIYCQIDDEGIAYLDGAWVSQILALDDFTNLYFDAIDRQDIDSLSELLRQTFPDDLARSAIAKQLGWYYRNQVETDTSEFKLQAIRIDGLTFVEKLINGTVSSNALTRTIEFIPQSNGTFLVDDLLPSELKASDTNLLLDDTTILQVGGDTNASIVTLYSVPFEAVVGKPALHDDSNCMLQDNGESVIRLSYDGLDLVIKGNCYDDHSRWRGQVTTATLTNDKFALGSGLKVGISAEDLYAQYPFISVGDKAATGQMESGKVALTATVENEIVTSLQLTIID